MIYLRNRDYEPSIGRFITEDPIRDGLNWYVYCGNNPVNRVDPTGYWEEGDELFPEFIQSAIIKYTEMYNSASDDDERFAAHAGAVRMRELGRKFTSRVEWGGPDFGDWEWDPDKDEIVVHHTANKENDISKIEEKHVKQGWSGVGYHFVIDQNGNVYEGRPFNAKGAHVDGNNTGKIGIALVGNFEPGWIRDNAPSEEQLRSLFRMVEALQMSAGWDMPVYGHRDYNDAMPNTTTVCPGQNLYDIIDRVY